MISKIRKLFVSFFNSHTDRIITSSLFDTRRMYMLDKALNTKEIGICNNPLINDRNVVVSLTTFGKRLYEVYLTIESIMQQTVKPNKIVLWLSDDYKEKEIPKTLDLQTKRGLEIRYCKDIKSYKKLIPSLKLFPEDFIITVDDDVIYNFDMIENLLKSYKLAPGYVYANRVKRIAYDGNKNINEYKTWEQEREPMKDSIFNMPTGVGGVLYPPHCFADEVLNEDVFMNICEHGDDIWFKTMCLINNTQTRLSMVHEPVYFENENVQDVALYNSNVTKNENDKQIKSVFYKYDIYSILERL